MYPVDADRNDGQFPLGSELQQLGGHVKSRFSSFQPNPDQFYRLS